MKIVAALFACTSWTVLTVQAQLPRPPILPRPAPPPTETVSPQAKIELPAPEAQTIAMDFPNAPVADVLRYYAALIGKPVVYDNTVVGTITVIVKEPVSREHAARLIEESLFLNGFSLIHTADDKTIKVLGIGKPGRSFGVPVYKSAEELPQSEQLVSLIVRLKHMNSQEMAARLLSYATPSSSAGCIASGGDTIILTGQTGQLRELLKVLETFDAPGAVAEKPEALK